MPRTHEELQQAAADAEAWLDALDPDQTPADDTADLRRVGLAVQHVATSQDELTQAVHSARSNGRSWARIATILGVTRQSARERYGQPAHH